MALNGPYSVTHPEDGENAGETVYFDSVAECNAYVKAHPDFPETDDGSQPETGSVDIDKIVGEYESRLSPEERDVLSKLLRK